MTQSRTEQMVVRLKDLQASTPDIEASAVVSVDSIGAKGCQVGSGVPGHAQGG